jgi:hypothetical protein
MTDKQRPKRMLTPEEYEEKKRRFKERCAIPIPDADPEVPAVVVAVDPQTGANAKARPESIRLATRDESGVTRVVGPQRYAVDGPSSAVGWMGWAKPGTLSSQGLWFTPEDDNKVVSTYDPIARFEQEER